MHKFFVLKVLMKIIDRNQITDNPAFTFRVRDDYRPLDLAQLFLIGRIVERDFSNLNFDPVTR